MTIKLANPDDARHFEVGKCYVERNGQWIETTREESVQSASHSQLVVTGVDHESGTVTVETPWMKVDTGPHMVMRRLNVGDVPWVFGFMVLGPPVSKGRPRPGKDRVFRIPKKTRDYQSLVRTVASMRVPPGWDMGAKMRVILKAFVPDNRKRDVDNIAKCVMDGMNRAVYRDDSQVVSLTVEKQVDRERPRVEVEVWRV